MRRVTSPPSSTTSWGPLPSGCEIARFVHHQYSSRVSPFHAKTGTPDLAIAAAAWSWVEKMLQLAKRRDAPRSTKVSIKTAVWIVMCNEPVIRTPANGLAFAYFARIAIRPGISCSAISISFRPNSARPRSATLWSTAVLVVTLLMYFELGQVLIESFGSIRTLPGKRFQVILAPEMTVVGRLPIDWAQEIQLFDDRCRLEVEYLLHGLLNFYL